MAKDISKFIIRLDDEGGWENLMEISNRKLVVVDCHQEWCGNVEAILPSMTRVMIEYDSAEERFQYASAPISKLGGKIQPSLPSDCKVDLEKNGCLPFFAVYRNHQCISVISGVDAPALLQQISMNMPEKPTKE